MTIGDPPAPPEGKLIRRARERAIPRLSIRDAAARIGISPEHWGNVERGYKSVKAHADPLRVEASPELLAKMAAVTGVSPEQMETEGQRPDAAESMRSAPPPGRRLAEAGPDTEQASPDVIAIARTMGIDVDNPADVWLHSVRRDIADAIMIYGASASGEQIFSGHPASHIEAQIWNDRHASRQSKELFIAAMRADRAGYETRQQGNGRSGTAGLAPALTLAGR